jgi:hypothetical protein
MKLKNKLAALLVASVSLAASSSNAATYAAGDLVLFFFQENGSQTVYVNLGQAYTYRGAAAGPQDATTVTNILQSRNSTQNVAGVTTAVTNLGTTLSNAFGGTWASMTNLYAGLAAVRSSSGSTTAAAVNGDPSRTIYTSVANDLVSDPGNRSGLGNTDMTTIASGIISMNTKFLGANDILQAGVADSNIDDQNPFFASGILDTAFGSLAGGVAQKGTATSLGSFGDVSNVQFALDLHRILATNGGAGTITAGLDSEGNTIPLRTSTYEGTITINSNGVVGFSAVPEPSSVMLLGLGAGTLAFRRRRNA